MCLVTLVCKLPTFLPEIEVCLGLVTVYNLEYMVKFDGYLKKDFCPRGSFCLCVMTMIS